MGLGQQYGEKESGGLASRGDGAEIIEAVSWNWVVMKHNSNLIRAIALQSNRAFATTDHLFSRPPSDQAGLPSDEVRIALNKIL